MSETVRDTAKRMAASVAGLAPQARYGRCIFILSHMRSATTALSNVLCTHADISGYGETHVSHLGDAAPGGLVVNLALRGAYQPRATFLLDKILHDRLDEQVPDEFYTARAIFMVREPAPAIRSVMHLAEKTDMELYRARDAAALYYAERVERLCRHWDNFPPEKRFGLCVEDLLEDPDRRVGEIGAWLDLTPPLTNSYVSQKASATGGGGDPLRSTSHTRIEPSPRRPAEPLADLRDGLAERCIAAREALRERFAAG